MLVGGRSDLLKKKRVFGRLDLSLTNPPPPSDSYYMASLSSTFSRFLKKCGHKSILLYYIGFQLKSIKMKHTLGEMISFSFWRKNMVVSRV